MSLLATISLENESQLAQQSSLIIGQGGLSLALQTFIIVLNRSKSSGNTLLLS